MNWMEQVDAYCERTDFSFWAEPVNAATNGLYLAGGLAMLIRTRSDRLPIATALSVVLILIAIGSFLFHTLATRWAGLADTAPIGVFILLYLWAVNRHVLRMLWWQAGLMTAGFVPYAAVVVPVLNRIPFVAISNFYWTVPILLLAYAPFVARRRRETALGMVAGALLLSVSISVRSVDLILCDVFPLGTHFLWHSLNAVLLPGMIELYRRHMLAGRAGQR